MADPHFDLAPSPWVQRWMTLIRPGAAVLDVAAGAGPHARLLARMGFEVDAVDRDASLFADPPEQAKVLQADIEAEPSPSPGRAFGGNVASNNLHRPSVPVLPWPLETASTLSFETSA